MFFDLYISYKNKQKHFSNIFENSFKFFTELFRISITKHTKSKEKLFIVFVIFYNHVYLFLFNLF